MKLKNNRVFSFLMIAVIYVLATVAGFFAYQALPYGTWLNLFLADVVATLVTFLFSLLFGNASVYDPYWSVQPLVILIAFAIGIPMNMARILMLIAVVFWGIRLTANWAYTFHGLTHQDWRYTMLHDNTGKWYPFVNFIGIHMVPTCVVFLCILPGAYLMTTDITGNAGSVFFFLVSIGAALLQLVSDVQLHRFRRAKTKGFIHTGAWKYSRHPNYLGEILMWWGVGAAACAVMPGKWFLLTGAFLNTCLFIFVSIPMADKHQARKEEYQEYKQQTRMLLLLPRKV